MKYRFAGIVDRMVTDEVELILEADDEGEAFLRARQVLDKFPEPHDVDDVYFCYVNKRYYHSPELYDLKEISNT